MPALNNPVQIISVVVSAALVAVVVELVRRRKLTEQYSLIWLLCGAALLVLSLWKDILDVSARWLGVYYPPAVLFLVLVFFGFVASLYFSVVISGQRQQIERLVEDLALVDERVREIEASAPVAVAASEVVHGATGGGAESRQDAGARGAQGVRRVE